MEITDSLLKLENGNYLFVQSLCDDPEYEFGYYYFDSNKHIIDGGVFNLDCTSFDDVIKCALDWCDLSTETTYELVEESPDLESLGFVGF